MFQVNRKSRLIILHKYLSIYTFFIGTYLTLFCSTNLADGIPVAFSGTSIKIMGTSKYSQDKVEATGFQNVFHPEQPPRKITLEYDRLDSSFSAKVLNLEKKNYILGSLDSEHTHFFCLLFDSDGLVLSYSLTVAFLTNHVNPDEITFYSGLSSNLSESSLEINADNGMVEFSMPSCWGLNYPSSQVTSRTVNTSLKPVGNLETQSFISDNKFYFLGEVGILVFQSTLVGDNKCSTSIYACPLVGGSHKESIEPGVSYNASDPAAKRYPHTQESTLFEFSLKNGRVRRPMNAFIVFSKEYRPHYHEQGIHHSKISEILGEKWRKMEDSEKEKYKKIADLIHKKHQEKYPGYKYQPRKKTRKFKEPRKSNIIASRSERTGERFLRKGKRVKVSNKSNATANSLQDNTPKSTVVTPVSSVANFWQQESFEPQSTEPYYISDNLTPTFTDLDSGLDSSFSSTDTNIMPLDELLKEIPLFSE